MHKLYWLSVTYYNKFALLMAKTWWDWHCSIVLCTKMTHLAQFYV